MPLIPALRGVFISGLLVGLLSHANPYQDSSADASRLTPIRIGLVTALNGDLRPWGIDCRDGAQMAVDEFNKAGGFNGTQVQLLVEDSGSKPEQGKSAAEKLISEGCITILGEVASGISAAMKEATTDSKVPQIVTGGTRTDLTNNSKYMFRVCYSDGEQGPVMAAFAYDVLGYRRMSVITDQRQPYSVGLSDSFSSKFVQLGGKVVDEERYNSGDTIFADLLERVKAHKPQGVFCSGYFTEVGPMIRQARESGIGKNVRFLGGDGWDSAEIVSTGGDAIMGSYFCNHFCSDDPSPKVKTFLKAWTNAYRSNPGTTLAALGYDAAGLALDALKRAKTPSAADMRDAIDETTDFAGVTGIIDLKTHHGSPPKRVVVVKLTKNRQSFVRAYEPAEVSSGGSLSR